MKADTLIGAASQIEATSLIDAASRIEASSQTKAESWIESVSWFLVAYWGSLWNWGWVTYCLHHNLSLHHILGVPQLNLSHLHSYVDLFTHNLSDNFAWIPINLVPHSCPVGSSGTPVVPATIFMSESGRLPDPLWSVPCGLNAGSKTLFLWNQKSAWPQTNTRL